jgi:phospholipid transport system substrate-binding protein
MRPPLAGAPLRQGKSKSAVFRAKHAFLRKAFIMRASSVILGVVLPLLASVAAPAYAVPASGDASAFVAELAQNALRAGNDKALSVADRQRAFSALLDSDFDLPGIARFVLGRYWQTTNDSERQEFTTAFRDFMVRSYSQRFTEYRGETFRVVGQHTEGASSTLVDTEITQATSGQVVKMEWRVVARDAYKIMDMSVGGVSMVLTQRDEFAASLERSGGGVPSLVRQMNSSAQQPH